MKSFGQVTTAVMMWGAGLMIASLIGATGYFSSSDAKIKEQVALQGERIKATETEIVNIKQTLSRIETKLDTLIAKQISTK